MNVDTGELRRIKGTLKDAQLEGFVEVPEELQEQANALLGENDSTLVDMKSNHPLVEWAKQYKSGRHSPKSNRQKMQKESKRRNRR